MNAPRGVVDSLTNTSKPAAMLYNELADGSKLMGKPIYNIQKDEATGNISFSFMTKETGPVDAVKEIAASNGDEDAVVFDATGNRIGRYSDLRNGALRPGLYIIGGKNNAKKIFVK